MKDIKQKSLWNSQNSAAAAAAALFVSFLNKKYLLYTTLFTRPQLTHTALNLQLNWSCW